MVKDSACQCGNTGSIPGPETRVPLAEGQLSPCTMTTEASAPSSPRSATKETRGNGAASTRAPPKTGKELWGNFRFPNIWVVGVSEGEVMRETEKVFEEIMAPNFPNWMKTINPQIPEAK